MPQGLPAAHGSCPLRKRRGRGSPWWVDSCPGWRQCPRRPAVRPPSWGLRRAHGEITSQLDLIPHNWCLQSGRRAMSLSTGRYPVGGQSNANEIHNPAPSSYFWGPKIKRRHWSDARSSLKDKVWVPRPQRCHGGGSQHKLVWSHGGKLNSVPCKAPHGTP